MRDRGLAAAADSVLFDYARQESAVVLTKDSDFVELASLRRATANRLDHLRYR